MDWSRIKTIFIVVFLFLDIYLVYEFIKLYNSSQYDYMAETTLENQLKTEEIKIKYEELPKDYKKGKYLTATPKKFSESELTEEIETKLKGQTIRIINETTLESILDEPLKVNENINSSDLNAFLRNRVVYGEQYRFWEINSTERTITFYQQLEDKLLYKNINAELTFYLNEDNEIESYRQTLLDDIEELSEEEAILQPIKAIEILFENRKLPYGSEITKVEPGYYTHVYLSSSQVLTPVWRIVLNDEENLFVNAVEGQIIQLNNEDKKIVE